MSKISRCVKRFEDTRIGFDERPCNTDGKPVGVDKRPLIRCVGIKGREAAEFMDIIDKKEVTDGLKFLVLGTLQKDDPTTTEAEYDNMDFADIITLGNVVGRLSGFGELFDFKKKQNMIPEKKVSSLKLRRRLELEARQKGNI